MDVVRAGAVGVTGPCDGFPDDAALFPPGEAPMGAAVPAHRELRARLGDPVGPFVADAAAAAQAVRALDDVLPAGTPAACLQRRVALTGTAGRNSDVVTPDRLPAPERTPA